MCKETCNVKQPGHACPVECARSERVPTFVEVCERYGNLIGKWILGGELTPSQKDFVMHASMASKKTIELYNKLVEK